MDCTETSTLYFMQSNYDLTLLNFIVSDLINHNGSFIGFAVGGYVINFFLF